MSRCWTRWLQHCVPPHSLHQSKIGGSVELVCLNQFFTVWREKDRNCRNNAEHNCYSNEMYTVCILAGKVIQMPRGQLWDWHIYPGKTGSADLLLSNMDLHHNPASTPQHFFSSLALSCTTEVAGGLFFSKTSNPPPLPFVPVAVITATCSSRSSYHVLSSRCTRSAGSRNE